MAADRSAGALAAELGATVEGDAARVLRGVASLEAAGPDTLSFLANPRYRRALRDTRAGAVLVGPGVPVPAGVVALRVADPYAAFAAALALFHPPALPPPGVSPQASVHPSATVDGATVDAFAFVGAGAVVGTGSWLQPGAVVGAGARVGRDCRLAPHAVVMDGCVLGDRVWLNPGAVVGAEGFGFAPTPAGNLKIPQVGRAVLEDDVELGAHTTVDRPALGDTLVRRGAKLDNFVQIGHAAEVGPHSLLVAYSGLAGSAKVGARTVLAARASVLGHIRLGDGVRVGVASAVHDDQPDHAAVTGVPAIPHGRWLEAAAAHSRLPELLAELRRLRTRVAALESALGLPSSDPEDPR